MLSIGLWIRPRIGRPFRTLVYVFIRPLAMHRSGILSEARDDYEHEDQPGF